jgi:hypothetical protein
MVTHFKSFSHTVMCAFKMLTEAKEIAKAYRKTRRILGEKKT